MLQIKSKAVRDIGLVMLALIIFTAVGQADPTTRPVGPRMIMIIRHAEKPEVTGGEKNPNLSDRGYQRAAALAKSFTTKFPRPDFLIATARTKGSNRPVETITPLSKALGEPVDTDFAEADVQSLSRDVLTNPKYSGKVVLIAWHHGKIPELAKALRVENAPAVWDSKVFDRVWQITYENGVAHWKDLPEKMLPGDSEK